MYSDQNFDQNISVRGIVYPSLNPFIQNRSASVLNEFDSLGYSNCGTVLTGSDESFHETGVTLYPNPFSAYTILKSDRMLNNATLSIYDQYGRVVKEIVGISGQRITLYRDRLTNGVYFIRLSIEGESISLQKLVVSGRE